MDDPGRARWRRAGAALCALAFAAFLLASPGRLDTIDAQYRFEAAVGLLDRGRPDVVEPELLDTALVAHNGAWHYALYSAPPSLGGAAAIALVRLLPGWTPDRDGFAFVLFTPLCAAAALAMLLDTQRRLGVELGTAVGTCLITAFATLLLPLAGSAFDQAQHAVMLVGAIWAASRGAWGIAGLFAGLGFAWREVNAVWVGPLGVACWLADRRAAPRLFAGLLPGVALWVGWNLWRAGSALPPTGGTGDTPLLGNPLLGLAGLTVSPGKGVLWYSPPIVLGLLGLRGLWARNRPVAVALAGASALHLGVYSCLSFFGGDMCWGPRYLVPVSTALMVAAPFAPVGAVLRGAVGVAGLAVQLLSLGRDYAVFPYRAGLPQGFALEHPEVYLSRSALLDRPGEIAEMLATGIPDEVVGFGSHGRPDLLTHANYTYPLDLGPGPLRRFAVYWLPVPWTFWMRALPPQIPRPIPNEALAIGLAAIAAGAALALARDVRGDAPA